MKDYQKKHYENEARYELAQQIDANINNLDVEIREYQKEMETADEEGDGWRTKEWYEFQIEIMEVKKAMFAVLLKEVTK